MKFAHQSATIRQHGKGMIILETALETAGLTYVFPDGNGIKNIAFQVKRGEIYALYGGHHAGKSVLLQTIIGTLRPQAGTLKLFGNICFAAVLFIAFGLLVAILNGAGRLTGGISLFLKLAIGFGIEAGVVVFVTTCLGAIVINLSRNIIVTSVVGVIYGFVSCLFIGSERGFVIPGSFAYRVSMFFSDKSTYYEVPISATIGGCISIVFCFIVLFLVGLIVFSHKKKIEN